MVMPRFVWDPLGPEAVGKKVSVLIYAHERAAVTVGGRQLVLCDSVFPPGKLHALHSWTLVDFSSESITLACCPESLSVELPVPTPGDFFTFSEVCADIGGTSCGAQMSGLHPLVALDQSSLAVAFLRRNKFPEVLHGDLFNLHHLGLLHQAHESRAGLLAGFPCQPFSTLGSQLAFDDPRAQAFFRILDLAFFMQVSFLLLECVVAAGRHRMVREALAAFCEARGFKCVEQVLHLHHALPNFRTRWWCLLVPKWLPDVAIPDLPIMSDFQTVETLFPTWPAWPLDQEKQLQLNAKELEVLCPWTCFVRKVFMVFLPIRHGHNLDCVTCILWKHVPWLVFRGTGHEGHSLPYWPSGIPDSMPLDVAAFAGHAGFLQLEDVIACHLDLVHRHVLSHRLLHPGLAMYERRPLTMDFGDSQLAVQLTCPTRVTALLVAEARLSGSSAALLAWDDETPLDLNSLACFCGLVSCSMACPCDLGASKSMCAVDCCGLWYTVALIHLGCLLHLWDAWTPMEEWHCHLHLVHSQCRLGFGPLPDGNAAIAWLETFLPSKGVLVDKARARAEQAAKRLGLPALRKALTSPDPWRALKSAGNVLGKPFQWITYEELQAHIAARAPQNRDSAQHSRKTRGKGHKKSEPSLALSPDTLTLYPTTFVDDNEAPVLPISFQEVGSNARGVRIVTVPQALDLCHASVHLSVDSLALVTIALYTPTSEPVLVKGSLINLGDEPYQSGRCSCCYGQS
eukprot:s1486_g20.t1